MKKHIALNELEFTAWCVCGNGLIHKRFKITDDERFFEQQFAEERGGLFFGKAKVVYRAAAQKILDKHFRLAAKEIKKLPKARGNVYCHGKDRHNWMD